VPVQFTIAITKDILKAAKYCGFENDEETIGRNCAIAFAMKHIFPDIYVTGYDIFPFGAGYDNSIKHIRLPLPLVAQHFVRLFDGFRLTPALRLLLPEFEFNIDIPDEVIALINIDEIRKIIETDSRRNEKGDLMASVVRFENAEK
jgi:hypothetical protein